MGAGDPSYDPGEASHRALRGIQGELERHPAISSVRGFPEREYTQVVAQVATERFGIEDKGTLTVRWFVGETQEASPEFSFHYSTNETDFGWHFEPNPHVQSRGHYQERAQSGAYMYEPYSFSSENPTRVVWEIMAKLTSRLES